MSSELDKIYEEFMDLYKENKIHFSWRKNSFFLSINETKETIEREKELKGFISKLVNTLRQKTIRGTIDSEYEEYEKYVDKLLEYDPQLKWDIITRVESNINICNSAYYEILTKRNKNLEIICYSALINLNLEKPNIGKDLLEQVNFELSIKDLKVFKELLTNAIEDIEKLSDNLE